MNATKYDPFPSTPTPWHAVSFADGMTIMEAPPLHGRHVCKIVSGNQVGDSHLIITAVNSHAALLAACQSALAIIKAFDMGRYPPANTRDVIQQLEAALQLGKGEQ